MFLTRHNSPSGPRLSLNGAYLPRQVTLQMLFELPYEAMLTVLRTLPVTSSAEQHPLLPPIEPLQEVWAAGVTYLRSRKAREAESEVRDVYEKVYSAEHPELFFKSIGWRVVGHKMPIRIRRDSHWNVPEPEMTLVINAHREIIGYCIGNDVSSRDIEGTNPLYLPQAKMYNGACAIGPGIMIASAETLTDLPIDLEIDRAAKVAFMGSTSSSQMKRTLSELVAFLTSEMDFPQGVFLMTGTGIVPEEDFSLQPEDIVKITIGSLHLENPVHI